MLTQGQSPESKAKTKQQPQRKTKQHMAKEIGFIELVQASHKTNKKQQQQA